MRYAEQTLVNVASMVCHAYLLAKIAMGQNARIAVKSPKTLLSTLVKQVEKCLMMQSATKTKRLVR